MMDVDKLNPTDALIEDGEEDIDPIIDIIDYLVRCANISFRNAHVDEAEVKTSEKIKIACEIFKKSPTTFLMQFGKYLAPYHIQYFEKLQIDDTEKNEFQQCLSFLKKYHSDDCRNKRIRNRRYKAMQKLQNESDYFSEKEMMYRDPLLYEQLVGQYLSDEEIKERDGVDNENLTFLNMILETVDRNHMREEKNKQEISENQESLHDADTNKDKGKTETGFKWGEFDTPDTKPSFTPEVRKQALISAPERKLLREEFLQEMYSSFIDGRDADVDYSIIDNDEQYDDLQQVNQDAEDQYFDSEPNDVENLEEHMKLVEEYGRKNSNGSMGEDTLDVFMKHIVNKNNSSNVMK